MSVVYHIYKNNGSGGPIDWTTVVATVSGLTWTSSALATPSDTTFAVRAYDNVTTYEDQNIDATARLVVSSGGVDITNVPVAPSMLTVTPTANASLEVDWLYAGAISGAKAPTGFKIYCNTPTVSYGSPAATVAFSPGRTAYYKSITGLTDGSAYQVVVRSYNATGDDGNTTVATATAVSTGPSAVDSLTVTVSSSP